jgi:GNAT superfamily N-acetyltransferase
VHDDALVGYLLAHRWIRQAPPPLGAVVTGQPEGDVLFIHDLAALPSERGSGVGRELVMQAFDLAARDGLKAAELIAVEGAAPYWRRLGFEEGPPSPELSAKVAEYGSDARWMTRAIGIARE